MSGNQVELGSSGIFSRAKGLFKKPQVEEALIPIKESASEVLARTTLPNRQVSLDDISLYQLPIDFTAGRRLAVALNEIKETPITAFDLESLKPPMAVYDAIPWVASAVAHHFSPDNIPVILPNEADVVAMKPWLRQVSQILGRFSDRWQYRFGRFIEKKAETVITEAADNILKRVDYIGELDHPRARFVPELADLYRKTAKPQYVPDDSFDIGDIFDIFSDESKPQRQKEVPIETKISGLVRALRFARRGTKGGWINKNSYPLVARATEISGFPSDTMDDEQAGVVGSEIMSGIASFIKSQGIRNFPAVPDHVRTFDLFDGDTWTGESVMRSLGETFAWDQIQAVKTNLPSILIEVQNLLPESGPEVVSTIRTLSENILILSKQGVSNAEIAVALFREPKESKKG